MVEHENQNQRIKRVFFWQIPGDVPGYRTQPDPYQGQRRVTNPAYQLPSHLDIKLPHPSKPSAVTLNRQTAAHSPTSGTAENKTGPESVKYLAGVIMLLLASIMVLTAYNQYVADVGENMNQASTELNADTIAQTEPVEERKIFELTLGKQNQTPQTRLRVVTHVVVKGDTLWDIAEQYVNDPFRYPELAELSKIKNPDLIYPYDIVRIHIYE